MRKIRNIDESGSPPTTPIAPSTGRKSMQLGGRGGATDPEYRERKLAPRRGKSRRNDQLKCHYGISLDDYNAMLAQQNGVCAICMKISDRTLSVDHCHTTGVVRGLLCRRCNTGLGCFEDQPSLVLRAFDYLGAFRGDQSLFRA
jgi:Autographiviridae endonuclease VII